MQITINGEAVTLENKDWQVTGLLEFLKVKPEMVAIEINGTVIDRELWAQTSVGENSIIEIMKFVGGG